MAILRPRSQEVRIRSITMITLAALLLVGPRDAGAQSEDAVRQFDRGLEMARRTRYTEAIAIWLPLEEALGPEAAPHYHKALGLAYRKSGRPVAAWHHLVRSREASAQPDKRTVRWERKVVARLSQTHRRVRIACPERVRIGFGTLDEPTYPCPIDWWLEPGLRTVLVVEAEGARTAELAVEGPPGESVWSFEFAAPAPKPQPAPILAPPPPLVVEEPPPIVEESPPASPVWAWVTVGAGAAVVVGAATLHGLTWQYNRDLALRAWAGEGAAVGLSEQQFYDLHYGQSVRPSMTAAWALYGVGGAALITGIVLVATHDAEERRQGSTPRGAVWDVAPMWTPGGGAGVRMEASW